MAIECSLKRLRGIDPLEEREAEKRKEAVATVRRTKRYVGAAVRS